MGKEESEKNLELLVHIDGTALQFYFDKFTTNGAVNDASKSYTQVKAAFLERFARRQEPQDVIRAATKALLDERDLLYSLDRVDALYSRAGFNEEAKYGFLRAAVTKIPPVATFAIYCGAPNYAQLASAVRDFDCGSRVFQAGPLTGEQGPSKLKEMELGKEVKLLVRPDVRVHNMKAKIDTLANQLSNLTLILKKSHAQPSRECSGDGPSGKGTFDRSCSYCSKPGHGASRCPDNPNRDRRCANCGKMAHGPETCWSKPKSVSEPR